MNLRFPKVRLSRRASGCPSCGTAVEREQLVCLECGTLQGSGARLGGAAWKMPVALVGALLLLMATGFGFASGAVGRDGEVTVAQAPPSTPLGAPPSADDEPEQEGVTGSGGSALPKLPGPSAAGSGRKLGFGGGSSSSLDDALGGGTSDEPAPGSGGGGGGGSSLGDERPNRGGGAQTTRTTPDPTPSEPSYAPARPVRLDPFPRGASGYVVVLKSSGSRAVVLSEARSAKTDGLEPAGVAASRDAGLSSGGFFAFAGRVFPTRVEAERFEGNNVAPLGYSGTVRAVGGA